MLSFLAALAVTQTHADRVTINTRVFSISQSARVDIDGAKVEEKKVGTYIVGLRLAMDGVVDELIKAHQASEVKSRNVAALIGQKISRDFQAGGQTQTVEILAEGASTTGSLGDHYGLDVLWRFGNTIYGEKGISHHFDLRASEGGLVLLMMDGKRWMMELTVAKD